MIPSVGRRLSARPFSNNSDCWAATAQNRAVAAQQSELLLKGLAESRRPTEGIIFPSWGERREQRTARTAPSSPFSNFSLGAKRCQRTCPLFATSPELPRVQP